MKRPSRLLLSFLLFATGCMTEEQQHAIMKQREADVAKTAEMRKKALINLGGDGESPRLLYAR